ncbi:MAG: AAA family ATPase [Cyanobacteria bacterium P01_D01_bin.73]
METSLPAVIRSMLKPAFYPHPVTEPVKLVQTHGSYVLLTGDWVYKVKKAVDFGFLDYSTLERRKMFCDREIELNKRGVEGLYVETVPIYGGAGDSYSFEAAGEPVEYAVKMHQFPQEDLLSTRFDAGDLPSDRIVELAKRVAEFHLSAPTDKTIRSYGTADRVKSTLDQNFKQTESYIGGPQTQRQYNETRAWTDAFFANNGELLQSRVDNHWIRNGHGDLHLGNICLWQDKVALFDCIEFNEQFRFVDVMYDVAFTVMDLDHRGRSDLANLFLNTYVERTGDWEGLGVLPLYLSRQSYVRAKVTSFLLDDTGVPEGDRQAANRSAAAYYTQAHAYTNATKNATEGKLLIMSGVSGSGKSTIAKQLAEIYAQEHGQAQKTIIIRSDAVRKHLGNVPLGDRGPASLYTAGMSAKTYQRLQDLGIELVQRGYTVILDAKYDRHALRQSVINAAKGAGIDVKIIACATPREVLAQRLRDRTGDIADATVDLLDQQLANAEPLTAEEMAIAQTIDTTRELKPQLA